MIRAVRCHEFAGLETTAQSDSDSEVAFRPRKSPKRLVQVLSLDRIPRPQLSQPNQVLIQVHYAGVQYPDALQARGFYQVRPTLPYIPGMDATGIVVQVGRDVRDLHVGDRVVAVCLESGGTGGMAEIIAVPETNVYRIPHDRLPLSVCSNIGRNHFAAYHSLKTIGNIGRHSLVLVDGASGGVGMATIELAKALNARVIAGVSTESKMEPCRTAGADRVFCYGSDAASYRKFKTEVRRAAQELGHPGGVDLVVDVVQGDLFEAALLSCVRPLGTIALVGFAAGQKPIRPGLLLIKEVNVVGSLWGRWSLEFPDQHKQNVAEILQFFALGAVPPRVDRIFPLQEFAKAFELFETNQGQGNTVVSFQDSDRDVPLARL